MSGGSDGLAADGVPAVPGDDIAGPICPFDFDLQVIDRLLNLELPEHPEYTGLEIQAFDDPRHGKGILAFLARRDDRRIDLYRQPGLRVDPEMFQVGNGVGRWAEAVIEPDWLAVTPFGLDADVGFRDAGGRLVEVRIDDRTSRWRRPARLLAPFGATVERPTSLLLAYMHRFDLVRTAGPYRVRIDGLPVRTGSLPGGRLYRRRLVKYAADIIVVRFNEARQGPVDTVDRARPGDVELAPDGAGVAAVRADHGDHHVRLELTPPLPDLVRMPAGTSVDGRWSLQVDDMTIGGVWSARRSGARADLILDVTRGWSPSDLPPLMRIVTSVVRMFRTWPTTYRWSATVELGAPPTMSSHWERKAGESGDGYRRLTQRQR